MPDTERVYQKNFITGRSVEVSRFGGDLNYFYDSLRSSFSLEKSRNGEFAETRGVFDKAGKRVKLLAICGDYLGDYYGKIVLAKLDRKGIISGKQLLLDFDKEEKRVDVWEVDIRRDWGEAYFDPAKPIVDGDVVLDNEFPEKYTDADLVYIPFDGQPISVDKGKIADILRKLGIGMPLPELVLLKRPGGL